MATDKTKMTDEVVIEKNQAPVEDPDRQVLMTHPSSDDGDYAVVSFRSFQELWEDKGWKIVDEPVSEQATTNTGTEEGA